MYGHFRYKFHSSSAEQLQHQRSSDNESVTGPGGVGGGRGSGEHDPLNKSNTASTLKYLIGIIFGPPEYMRENGPMH